MKDWEKTANPAPNNGRALTNFTTEELGLATEKCINESSWSNRSGSENYEPSKKVYCLNKVYNCDRNITEGGYHCLFGNALTNRRKINPNKSRWPKVQGGCGSMKPRKWKEAFWRTRQERSLLGLIAMSVREGQQLTNSHNSTGI